MSLALTLVVAAVVALGVLLNFAVSRNLQGKPTSDAVGKIRPIDVVAFRNLIDPAENEYLRRSLPPAQFRLVQRARLRAMAAYIQVVGENATALVRMGELALTSADPRIAAAAQQVVNDALRLRRNSAVAMARIYLALAWPNSEFPAERVVDRYEQLSGPAMLLGRLQNPAAAVRLASHI